MKFSYDQSQAMPVSNKYQIGEAMAVAGVPVEVPTLSDTAGVLLCEVNTCADCLGVTMDAQATRNTAQQSDNSDPAVLVTVITNPFAVYKAVLSNDASQNTALTLYTETAGDTTGLLITSGLATDGVYDDGIAWGYDGANPKIVRKITGGSATTAVPIIAFPNDIDIGDNFLACTFEAGGLNGLGLTTLLDQINSADDEQGTDNFRCIRMDLQDEAGEGRTNSFAYITIFDHLFAGGGSI